MRIYLIRHGQSAANVNYLDNIGDPSRGKEHHKADPALTDAGHRQARLLGEHLAHPSGEPVRPPWLPDEERVPVGFGITHIYCSLMLRAVQTAQYVAESCGLPLVAHTDLFEKEGIVDYDDNGNLVGIPGPGREYFAENFPNLQLPDDLTSDGWYNRPLETDEMFLERSKLIMPFFEERHRGTDDCIALVTHGDTIDQIVNDLTGAMRRSHDYDKHWCANWVFLNTSVTRIDYVGSSRAVVYTNQTSHLPPDLITW
ncbi:MAG: histidine phosphatase family protein [Alphaproteobacteria bacterium]